VQGVLAARIDRLPAQEKDLLQTLAVIGKEFPFGLLRAVAEGGEEDLYRGLSHLQAGEFIYEQPAFPEPEYTFKHALTQEVAYGSLLVERRRPLHERTARVIEERYRDRLDEHYGELAHHYGRSQNIPKAVEYLTLAGEQAVQRSAYAEAIRQVSRGVELVETRPESRERARQELPLQLALGGALTATQGYGAPEAERAYARARDLCEQLGEASRLFETLQAQWVIHLVRAEHDRMGELAELLLRLARGTRDPAQILVAQTSMGSNFFWRGEFSQARKQFEEVIGRYDPHLHRYPFRSLSSHPGLWSLLDLSWALEALGYLDQAIARSREAFALATELSDPFGQANALLYASRVHWQRGESQAHLEGAEALIALSREHGFLQLAAMGTFQRAASLADQGQLQEGFAGMHAILDAMRASGVVLGLPPSLAVLAEAHGKAGEAEEGLALMAEALEFMAKTGERVYEAEVHRLKGELLLARSPSDHGEAEVSFRKALDVARHQSAKSWELRAATSLARLWQRQGRRDEAHDLLAPVYAWFTEGFDTRDLREAKALLQELA
jgi:predicted ATPase